jgi:hypothetical protein
MDRQVLSIAAHPPHPQQSRAHVTVHAPVNQWDIVEVALAGPATGNPFVDVELAADFQHADRVVRARGFYDGNGLYRVRFMPDEPGLWRYVTHSNSAKLDEHKGTVLCTPAPAQSHGPVRVHNTFHFAHADGTPYRQIGTTCYAWTHQGKELEEETLRTLARSPFNKLRMCVFPKRYAYNFREPSLYPFEGNPPKDWDFTRFNPAFFQHLERRVKQLNDLGIQADVILFHPYDEGHWGFDRMDEATNERYIKYLVARLAAYSNVWWSMANEFDFIEKQPADWDHYFKVLKREDPYGRLCSIHNGKRIYDHNKPWITHASIQNGSAVQDFGRAVLYRDVYNKPIVFDEVKYEGDLPQRWGNISAEEMVHHFWQGAIAGTYVGHGETYLHPEDVIWWACGGTLHGKSPERLHFLKQILDTAPASGLDPTDKWQDLQTAGKAGEYYLIYFGKQAPTEFVFELPREKLADKMEFKVDVIDTWNMTITPVEETFKIVAGSGKSYRYPAEGNKSVKLPGRPYMALRVQRVGDVPSTSQNHARIYGE